MIRALVAVLLCAGLAIPLDGCGSSKGSTKATTPTHGRTAAENNDVSITIAGSTALLPLVKQAAQDYELKNPNAKISVSGGGSRVGITQASQKGVDIGNSDIPAPEEPNLVDHKVAIVQFDIAVNPASGVTHLTTAQIQSIFSGKVTNFNQVGGNNVQIAIVNRPRSSGTRAVFIEKLMHGAQPAAGGITQDSSGTVASIVEQTPAAITYVANSYVKGAGIMAVSIDGVAPSEHTVSAGKYTFWSYEHMFTNGRPTSSVAAFIDFVESDTTALKGLGFIPVGSR
ncbi:MAG: phosphate ABC transporter substrate-binding protein [Candidatus Eremiobacteraeota bacterium]|nr:phosphate ABC transporter substrate-binding protein [Candidatus Eremiobacteraeota bacterium]